MAPGTTKIRFRRYTVEQIPTLKCPMASMRSTLPTMEKRLAAQAQPKADAENCHAAGQGLYWIPYYLGPGYKHWKALGIDQAWMQPNWYWDLGNENAYPFEKTLAAIREADLAGMELELEYTAVADQMTGNRIGPDGEGRPAFTAKDVPALQARVRRYMQEYKEAGFLGQKSVALYSGSNAFTQLATSAFPEDRALYDEVCEFIIGNRKMQLTH